MKKDPVHVQFQNSQNPSAAFDLIRLEDLFTRGDIKHSPMEQHLVEFYIIILIEEGRGLHTIDFTEYKYKKGSLITIRKDQIHKFHRASNVKGTLVLFTDDFLVSYLEVLESLKSLQLFNELLGEPLIQLTKAQLSSIIEILLRIQHEYFDVNDEYSLGIIRSELQILIVTLYRIKASKNQIVSNRRYLAAFIEFQSLVEKHVTQHTKVKAYAQMLGVSTKTVNTISKTIVNKSAKEFIDDICTKQIKRLLINTELTVKEIAYASGFEESSNFYKYFKRQTQLTPEQFRTSNN